MTPDLPPIPPRLRADHLAALALWDAHGAPGSKPARAPRP